VLALPRVGPQALDLDHHHRRLRAYRPLEREYLDHWVINFFGNLKTGMRGACKRISISG
jgi:hypothetical protein